MINEIIKKFKQAERDRIFPFSEWHRKDIFERLIKDLFIILGYNPDQIDYEESNGTVELKIKEDLKAIIYLSSLQENQRFLSNKISALIDTIPDPETGKPAYEIAVVTNFDTWFFYFDGREIYAVSADRLENEYETIKLLISKEVLESGKFKEVARKLLHKEDNEPLRQELNSLRVKIANKILQEKTNIHYLKNPDGLWNNEILNEITTRWITRFLSLKLAEDFGISFNFTLRDIRRSFELSGNTAKPVPGAKVKEETLSNAIRALMNEFERRYNGGIFIYEEGVDYITIPDTAFFDLLDFATGWAFTIEDARIIGFVYERFLGQEIVVEERNGNPEAVLKSIGEARGRRKASGIYYTPKYIVDYIVENTLGEILKEKRDELDKAVKNIDCDKFISVIREVKSLKVLDPACGSGSFLIKVLAEFKNFYEEIKNKKNELKSKIEALKKERIKAQMLFINDKELTKLLSKYNEIEKEIEEIEFPGTFALRLNIYGVDIDLKAIDISAFTLMVQVYDELKNGARCPTMIGENLKVGNSLVSAITPEKRNGFISREELVNFKDEIAQLIKLRKIEKTIDVIDENGLKELIKENFNDVVEVYKTIKEKYPNAIPTPQQKLLDEWYKRAKKEPVEKTYNVLINQTGLARIFLKEVYFEKIERIKEKIEFEINKPLVKYFNSEKKVLKDEELEKILGDEEKLKEEYRFIKDRATEISKSQPPKVFNWELEFPEVFFNEDGTLKENPGFDVIVGNPPWGFLKDILLEKNSKNILTFLPLITEFQTGKLNLYKLFIEKCYQLANVNGYFSMIFPAGFLGEKDSINLRKLLFERTFIKRIIYLPVETVYELFKKELLMDATIFTYQKTNKETITFKLKTDVKLEECPILSSSPMIEINAKNLKNITQNYEIPSLSFMEKEWNILQHLSNFKKFHDYKNEIKQWYTGVGPLIENKKEQIYMCEKGYGYPLVRGIHVRRYYVETNPDKLWKVKLKEFLNYKPSAKTIINFIPKLVGRRLVHRSETWKLHFSVLEKPYATSDGVRFILVKDENLSLLFLLGILNSALLNWRYKIFSRTYNVMTYEIESLPIVRATPEQQAPIISLVDAIIQKKKEYHSISQNIEDYVKFEELNLIRLDDFIKNCLEDFSVLSSIRAKTENFDALRLRIENDFAIIEYGIKRKIEEYEIEQEDEEGEEIKGKHVINWFEAGSGKIKDKDAIEFLSKILKGTKNFSKAKQKTIWQKIAEVKVPEFNEAAKEGFLNYKSAIEKAELLDEEITKIDRAIDRLVYDLYGLTEEEIQVVEKSIWGEKFQEMYSKLPSKEEALKVSEEVKKWVNIKEQNG
jgi:hypothetical protein